MKFSPLTLGTAQFGKPYGITNRTGIPSDTALSELLRAALAMGITCLDTARVYGNAEERLGALTDTRDWTVISKVAPHEDPSVSAGDHARYSVEQSLRALRRPSIDVVMFHRFRDSRENAAIRVLEMLAEEGSIGEIGVSVYSPDEAIQAINDGWAKHLQIPFNPLDRRWFDENFLAALSKRTDVCIHSRSVFLQGLLISERHCWPSWAQEADAVLSVLDRAAAGLAQGRTGLCVRYQQSFPWIATSVVGVETLSQLRQISEAHVTAPLESWRLEIIEEAAMMASPRLLNPALW